MNDTTGNGYVTYLEQRLALAEDQLRKQGVFSLPQDPIIAEISNLPVGSVIQWFRRYPRGDVYKFVAYLQRSNEWHMVSGKSKFTKNHVELATEYLAKGFDIKVLS